jgi:hypothetical protein
MERRAGGDHGGVDGGAVKVAEGVVVVSDGGDGGGGAGCNRADEKLPLAVLRGPQHDGQKSEPEQMRLEAEREQADACEQITLVAQRVEEGRQPGQHERGNLAGVFGNAGWKQRGEEGESDPLLALLSAKVAPEHEEGSGFERE